MPYLLDTDHISLHQRGHPSVSARVGATPFGEIAVSIVSVEEQLRGWLTVIHGARGGAARVRAYAALHIAVSYFCRVPILDFNTAADARTESLQAQKVRLGTQDLRIAAIALNAGYIFVTRNRRDFSQVPGLQIEDWT